MIHALKQRWNDPCGYRAILIVAIPLIIGTGISFLQQFIGRMFLARYSLDAMSAAVPAGMLNFSIMTIFLGTASYTGTFIAQYYGSKQYNKIGSVLWQGMYIALLGGLAHLALIPLAPSIFSIFGHAPHVQQFEVEYFSTLCLAVGPGVAASVFSGYFSGLGRTVPLMWVNIVATAVNILASYVLIYGKFGFPEMGIRGAALSPLISYLVSCVIFACIVFSRKNEAEFRVRSERAFNKELFTRIIKYGFPNGIQFFLDMAAYTTFIILTGLISTDALAASNIAFNINGLAFMPLVGFGIAINIRVGQHIGEQRPDMAEKSAYSGFHLALTYMVLVGILYVTVPHIFVELFRNKNDLARFEQIKDVTAVLLRFIALYSIFDSFNIAFSSAIKGAGDTHFVMKMLIIISLFVLIIPSYIAIKLLHGSIYTAWILATAYVCVLGFSFFLRFRHGAWKTMKVI